MSGPELRQALRSLLRRPGFTAAAVLSLAIGIGANAAIFSVASALLLRPLPYRGCRAARDPVEPIAGPRHRRGLVLDGAVLRHQARASRLRGASRSPSARNYNLTGDGEPERIGTIRVSSNLLPMLGARAVLGRLFAAEDDVPGRRARAVLTTAPGCGATAAIRASSAASLDAERPAVRDVGVLPAGFSLPREVMPTLGGAEHAELVAAAAARGRRRADAQPRGLQHHRQAEAGRRRSAQAQAEMDALTRAPAPRASRTSIRRTAG